VSASVEDVVDLLKEVLVQWLLLIILLLLLLLLLLHGH
jgi:hypothetical protein